MKGILEKYCELQSFVDNVRYYQFRGITVLSIYLFLSGTVGVYTFSGWHIACFRAPEQLEMFLKSLLKE